MNFSHPYLSHRLVYECKNRSWQSDSVQCVLQDATAGTWHGAHTIIQEEVSDPEIQERRQKSRTVGGKM